MSNNISGLYIHIPFCQSKCFYCDFTSFTCKANSIDTYLNSLKLQASKYSQNRFDTLYIGGGTPSILNEVQLKFLFNFLEEYFGSLFNFKEVTLEANPESLDLGKLKLLAQRGVNRLSLGLQSTDDNVLKQIGRIHKYKQFHAVYNQAKDIGFDNINIDLIALNSVQDFSSFEKSLKEVVLLNPEHISIYGLELKQGSKFFKDNIEIDDNLILKKLEFAKSELMQNKYNHYEISNFAKRNNQSLHNSNYWANKEYVGLGISGVSYIDGNRISNTNKFDDYIKNPHETIFSETLVGKEKIGEEIILGLRKLDGIILSDKILKYFDNEIKALIKSGLLIKDNNIIKLSNSSIFISNEVFSHFVKPF